MAYDIELMLLAWVGSSLRHAASTWVPPSLYTFIPLHPVPRSPAPSQPSPPPTMTTAVFPASGGLGTATYSSLLTLLDPRDVVLVSRHPEKLQRERESGATLRRADFDDPVSLRGVFDGVETLNLISYPSIEYEHRFEVSPVPARARASRNTLQRWRKRLKRSAIGLPVGRQSSHRCRPRRRRPPHLLLLPRVWRRYPQPPIQRPSHARPPRDRILPR